ncbi:FKBP-type peptidyl-prolyl cis-trans isomerase [Glacieibacterium sp.]|uniref:FKBP-type peptidyl-prolyl cis-trans isomerase n=1 Tax=Glacieibacterium sp. TaxID=2860237 RepID=UPI003B008C32
MLPFVIAALLAAPQAAAPHATPKRHPVARHKVAPAPKAAAAAQVTLPGGTIVTDVKVGTGAVAETGHYVLVHYTGWLYVDGKRGKKFDSSRDRDQPFPFPLGGGQVIAGWDEGIAGMKVGGQRTLVIPPQSAYGADAAGPDIPANSTLIFDVELLAVQ